jgi:hypothetical protein
MSIFLLAASLLWVSPAGAQSPLDEVVSITAAPGLEFHAICRALKLPCAIELDGAAAGDPGARKPFRVEGETISKALSRAIQFYPGHRWRLRKGVVYVTPNVAIEDSPLDRPLNRTKFTESLDTARAEFGPQAGFCSVPRGGGAPGKEPRAEQKISFEVSGDSATPRGVLTGLVLRHGRAGWVVGRTKTAKSSIFCLDLFDYDD